MNQRRMKLFFAVLLCFMLALPTVVHARTIYSNETGTHDGYDYEFWKDSGGSGSMTLNSGGTFSAEWSNVNNPEFRK